MEEKKVRLYGKRKERITGERGVLVSGWQRVGMDRVQNG